MPNSASSHGKSKPAITPTLDLLKKCWGEFKPLWSKFVLLQLILFIPLVGVLLVAIIIAFEGGIAAVVSGTTKVGAFSGAVVLVAGIVAVILASTLSSIATVYLARDRDPKPGVWERFWGAKEKLWGYLWVGFLAAIPIFIGWFLLLVPGIILSVMFAFVWFAYLFEGRRGLTALRASRELVRGFWWTVFARFLVYFVLMSLVFIPAYIPLLGFFWQLALQFVIGPISILFVFHVWEELRAAKKRSAGATDGMTGGKKFGLGVLIAAPLLLIPIILALLVTATALHLNVERPDGTGKLDIDLQR